MRKRSMHRTGPFYQKTPATSTLTSMQKWLLLIIAVVAGGTVTLPFQLLPYFFVAIGVAAFALLWRVSPNYWYLTAIPVSYILASLFSGFSDFLTPIEASGVVLGGIALAVTLQKETRRTVQVLWVSLILGVLAAFVGIVSFVSEYGWLSFAEMKELIEAVREELVSVILQTMQEATAGMTPATANMYNALLSEETLRAVIDLVILCAPSVCVIVFMAAGFLSTVFYVQAVRYCRVERYLPKAPYAISMSLPAAILYCASFLLMTVFSTSNTVLAVALNLLLLLLPGFAVFSAQRYFWRRRHGLLGRWGNMTFLLVLMLLFLQPFAAFMLMGLCGAYETIEIAFRRRGKKS